ncbi:MAG TPA: RNA polymerase-binding protein RbpA [Streptosporangiaceae bacterium]
MASYSLPVRGSRPGVNYTGEVPYEQPAARQEAPYACQRGHRFTVPFAASITPPAEWECRCGAPAGTDQPAPAPARDGHWRKVLERRTVAELEHLLADRLAVIRRARGR